MAPLNESEDGTTMLQGAEGEVPIEPRPMSVSAYLRRAKAAAAKGHAIAVLMGDGTAVMTDETDARPGETYAVFTSEDLSAETLVFAAVLHDRADPVAKTGRGAPSADLDRSRLEAVHSAGAGRMIERYEVALREADDRLRKEREDCDRARARVRELEDELSDMRREIAEGGDEGEIAALLHQVATAYMAKDSRKEIAAWLARELLPRLSPEHVEAVKRALAAPSVLAPNAKEN